jgi:hypothetical protein
MPIQKYNSGKVNVIKLILLSSFLSVIVGAFFAIIFFIGETFGFLPTINLGTLPFGQAGDVIILFVVGLMVSVFMGSMFVIYILMKRKI